MRALEQMYFLDIADRAVANPFDNRSQIFGSVSLNTGLRRHLMLARSGRHRADFVDGMPKRLLAKHMFSQLHSGKRDDRVRVVRSANYDAIDALVHLMEHLPPVVKTPGIWVLRDYFNRRRERRVLLFFCAPVYVAKGNYVVGRELL